jgi:hypothetical protein
MRHATAAFPDPIALVRRAFADRLYSNTSTPMHTSASAM